MITKALEFLKNNFSGIVFEKGNNTYFQGNGEIKKIKRDTKQEELTISNLNSILRYINDNKDDTFIIHVVESNSVLLKKKTLNLDMEYETILSAKPPDRSLAYPCEYNKISLEEALSRIHNDFYENEDMVGLINLLSTIEADEKIETNAKNFSLSFVTRNGINLNKTELQNPITLCPMLGFIEVEPPVSIPYTLFLEKTETRKINITLHANMHIYKYKAKQAIDLFFKNKLDLSSGRILVLI